MLFDKQLKFSLSKENLFLRVENNLIELLMGKQVFITFVVFVILEPAPPIKQIFSYFCE